ERWAPALKPEERLPFTFASYNCGRGTMLRASYLCGGCLDWRRVRRFVPDITRHYLIKIKALMGVRQN
ncbi:MAG: hypothetical protein KDK25_10710, partial [Leptospiraceae bacterium]|nr:hypothetical protein [Leptospiraceae bacterium]